MRISGPRALSGELYPQVTKEVTVLLVHSKNHCEVASTLNNIIVELW